MAMKLILEIAGLSYPVTVDAEENTYTVELPSGTRTLDVRRAGSTNTLSLLRDGESVEVWTVGNGTGYHVQVLGTSFDVEVEDALRAKLKALGAEQGGVREDVILAPMPGVVVELKARVGDRVRAGEPIVIVEAMKMRNEFGAKIDGVVGEILVEKGQSVERRTRMCIVVPAEEEGGS